MCDVIPVQWFWEISLLLEIYIKCTNEEKKKKSKAKADSSTNEKKRRKTVAQHRASPLFF
jgi:hypothetical protein